MMANIDLLIEAARCLDRESDHGYAKPAPEKMSDEEATSPPTENFESTSKTVNDKKSHNELERKRRANLRCHLDNLRDAVPLNKDCTRATTLTILQNAIDYSMYLEKREQEQLAIVEDLKNQIAAKEETLAKLKRQKCTPPEAVDNGPLSDSSGPSGTENSNPVPRRSVRIACMVSKRESRRKRRKRAASNRAFPMTEF